MAGDRVARGRVPRPVCDGTTASRPALALYVHVPFCVSLCPYCDFVVVAGSATRGPTNKIGRFLEALSRELELRADTLDAAFGPPGTRDRPPLETVYIGGGTPSIVPAEAIGRLLGRVRKRFGLADGAEITLEANPGPDERGDPAALRRAGITRISFGAQSLDDTELRRLGRRHRARHVAEAVSEARAAGVASINVDLLYDIPDTDLPTWMSTLDRVLELAPEHLSLYALALDDPDAEGLTGPFGDHLPVTKGARRWRDGVRPGQDEDRAAAQYHHAVVTLTAAGYRGYEISNWAQPGTRAATT
jgi:coproporphyrinogen III oxidase-like Fe-S oxidoreductase